MTKYTLTGNMGVMDGTSNVELIPYAYFTTEVTVNWDVSDLTEDQHQYLDFVLRAAYDTYLINNGLILPFIDKDWMVGMIGWPEFKKVETVH